MKKIDEKKGSVQNLENNCTEINLISESRDAIEIRRFTHSIINSVINSYKLRYLTEWERDHSTKPFTKEIESLEEKKRLLDEILKKTSSDVKITIDVKLEY